MTKRPDQRDFLAAAAAAAAPVSSIDARALDKFYTNPDIVRQCVRDFEIWTGIDLASAGDIIEPSAGAGAFLDALPAHTLGYDIAPEDPRVRAQDFLKLRRTRSAIVIGKARLRPDGTKHADIAIPVFGYKTHAGIDRRHGFIRKWDVTDASRHEGRILRRGLLDRTNTGSTVWADGAYRSKANEIFMEKHGFRSQVHHRKPKGRPMAAHIRRGNTGRSKIRAAVEYVFAQQKGPMGLFIHTIGLARAKVKIGMANIAYNMSRLVWQERRRSPA